MTLDAYFPFVQVYFLCLVLGTVLFTATCGGGWEGAAREEQVGSVLPQELPRQEIYKWNLSWVCDGVDLQR